MRIILTETVSKLGNIGDVVTVRDGYGRNYLIPRKLAIVANEKNVKGINHQKQMLESKRQHEFTKAQEYVGKLSAVQLTITRKAGEHDKLFGSVTSGDISEALKIEGFEVDRRTIVLSEPIKTVGQHAVSVRVMSGVEATVKIQVVGEPVQGSSETNTAAKS